MQTYNHYVHQQHAPGYTLFTKTYKWLADIEEYAQHHGSLEK